MQVIPHASERSTANTRKVIPFPAQKKNPPPLETRKELDDEIAWWRWSLKYAKGTPYEYRFMQRLRSVEAARSRV